MATTGRRPGNQDTRAAIVAAARAAFTEEGYERASLRGIARRAGVDPSLIHHYFNGKPDLFVEVLHLARDPRSVAEEIHPHAGEPGTGAALVRAFLMLWEAGGGIDGSRFITAVQAVSASREAADGLREFLMDRVWSYVGENQDPAEAELSRSLVAAQLFGIAWARYVLRLEPFASASHDQIAEWVGPTMDGYFLPPISSGHPQPS